MPSALPTDDAGSKAVKDFGIGTYDALSDSDLHGEDDEEREPSGTSLPDGGGYEGPFLEFWLSYPQEEALQGKHASSELPGDSSHPPQSPRPADDTFDDVLPTSGPVTGKEDGDDSLEPEPGTGTKLPTGQWPSARSDYYDRTVTGSGSRLAPVEDMWAPESTGAYVSNEAEGEGSNLPGAPGNDASMDDFLGALGNLWSGFVLEDQSVPRGFPSEDFLENSAYPKSGDGSSGGRILAHGDASNTVLDLGKDMNRTATNLELVGDLTKEFLKEFGKKDLVRRHVLAFLTERGLPQYLASDIIRCMKHRHKVTIPDVMDTFPVKTASERRTSSLASTWEEFIRLEHEHILEPEVASKFRRCAANIAHVMAGLERIGYQDG
jgi:hypothetical protein